MASGTFNASVADHLHAFEGFEAARRILPEPVLLEGVLVPKLSAS